MADGDGLDDEESGPAPIKEPAIQVFDYEVSTPSPARNRSQRGQEQENKTKPAFIGRGPEIHVNTSTTLTPLQFLKLFFTEDVIAHFVTETNAYAASKGRQGWKELSPDELWTLFALYILMSTFQVPQRRNIWRKGGLWYNENVANYMTCRRFEGILACLHWGNTAAFTKQDKKAKKARDCFWVLDSLLTGLDERFRSHFIPGQERQEEI